MGWSDHYQISHTCSCMLRNDFSVTFIDDETDAINMMVFCIKFYRFITLKHDYNIFKGLCVYQSYHASFGLLKLNIFRFINIKKKTFSHSNTGDRQYSVRDLRRALTVLSSRIVLVLKTS